MHAGKHVTWVLLAGLLMPVLSARAQVVPSDLPLQGYLTDASDAPIDGSVEVRFRLYDAATGGTALFDESLEVDVEDGYFATSIGEGLALANLFRDVSSVYLGVTVGTDAEISPRSPLLTAPYAFSAAFASDAETLGGLDASAFAQESHAHAFSSLTGIPDGLLDGDQVGASYTAGDGIMMAGETINVNALVFQRRIDTGCPANAFMVGANADGTPSCRTAEVSGGGDITEVSAGFGLVGGGTQGAVTLAVSVNGITATHLADNSVNSAEIAADAVGASEIAANAVGTSEIDSSVVQRRVSSACSVGSAIRSIAADGTVTCQTAGGTPPSLVCNTKTNNWLINPGASTPTLYSPTCDAGYVLTGGGCSAGTTAFTITNTSPHGSEPKWECRGKNNSSSVTTEFYAEARCCRVQ